MIRLGVDLGGTGIKVGLVENGRILKKGSCPTGAADGAEAVIDRIAALCREVAGEKLKTLSSAGIGTPGVLSADGGEVILAANLNFVHTPLAAELSRRLGFPVRAENDANCAALAESRFGAAAGCRNVVLVTLGTGVGGGVIVGGEILSGAHCSAGELGHMTLAMDGERCTCGRRGCLEAYASATALVRDTRRAMEAHPDSALWRAAGGSEGLPREELLRRVNGRTAFLAAREGDAAASAVVSAYIHALAEGIANLVNLFRPEKVLLGGGISHEGDPLLLPLEEEVRALTFGGSIGIPIPPIRRAALGNDAGIIGAALL